MKLSFEGKFILKYPNKATREEATKNIDLLLEKHLPRNNSQAPQNFVTFSKGRTIIVLTGPEADIYNTAVNSGKKITPYKLEKNEKTIDLKEGEHIQITRVSYGSDIYIKKA